MKKATVESLIADREKGKYDKGKTKIVDIPSMGFSLELRQPPLSKLLDMINDASETTSTSEGVRFMANIVYESCPMLHNKELLSAFEVVEPPDIVLKILNDDIGALSALSQEVLAFFGMAELDNLIKN